MKHTPLEIIIPAYNEGENILKLMKLFNLNVKTRFKVLICYDLENDNLFNYQDQFKDFNFEIELIKNPSKGPLTAIKQGFLKGNLMLL